MNEPNLGVCERSACKVDIQRLGFRIWNNQGCEPPYRDYCAVCGRKIMDYNKGESFKLRCELLVPLVPHLSNQWSSYRDLVERYAQYATVEQVEHYNVWFSFEAIQETITAIQSGKYDWQRNRRCKYVDIRIDVRCGKVRLVDRFGKTITPAIFASQTPEPEDETSKEFMKSCVVDRLSKNPELLDEIRDRIENDEIVD